MWDAAYQFTRACIIILPSTIRLTSPTCTNEPPVPVVPTTEAFRKNIEDYRASITQASRPSCLTCYQPRYGTILEVLQGDVSAAAAACPDDVTVSIYYGDEIRHDGHTSFRQIERKHGIQVCTTSARCASLIARRRLRTLWVKSWRFAGRWKAMTTVIGSLALDVGDPEVLYSPGIEVVQDIIGPHQARLSALQSLVSDRKTLSAPVSVRLRPRPRRCWRASRIRRPLFREVLSLMASSCPEAFTAEQRGCVRQ